MTAETMKRRIRARMVFLGLNGEEMAARMHLSQSSWSRRMRFPGRITVDDLIRIEKILKCKLLTED